MKGNFVSIALIVIGAIALAVNLDLIEFDLVALLRKWWPLALIAFTVLSFPVLFAAIAVQLLLKKYVR